VALGVAVVAIWQGRESLKDKLEELAAAARKEREASAGN
jgi:hypothetical protein